MLNGNEFWLRKIAKNCQKLPKIANDVAAATTYTTHNNSTQQAKNVATETSDQCKTRNK